MKYLLFIILLLSTISGYSQPENIMISDTLNPEEPSIYINTKNPALVIAGANINSIYLSQDTGRTWSHTVMTSTSGVWGDPCLISDTAGDFYFIHLANPPSGSWIDRIVCQKYDVDSAKWTYDSYMGLNGTKVQDKAWIAVDPVTNNLYVTWTQFDQYGSNNPADSSVIMFSRSTDGGATWSTAKRINKTAGDCIDSDNTVEGAVPAVGPNGEVYVAWAGPDGLVFDRSLDTGNSWLDNDISVSTISGGWDYSIPGISRANGLPITACDLSNGPYRGNIYINWSDQRNGINNTDVWLVKSTDGGNTWSAPARVNDDTTQNHQFFTWMTIDQKTGYLYFVFYDRRNHTGNNTDVYLAVSKDGGQTFQNIKISESPFLPNSQVFFGDYTNISAYNGIVRPIWTRLHNDSLSVWTAIINVDSSTTLIEYPENRNQQTEASAYPNPAKKFIAFSYKIHHKANLKLEIVDNSGKRVAVIFEENRPAGMFIEKIDTGKYNLTPGVYYFVLYEDNDVSVTKKFIVN